MWFFNSLKNFCFFNFSLDLERFVLYILMDACDAKYNAVSSFFPLTNLLMCWYHVEYGRKNVQTLAGTDAKLTPNKALKYTYKRK